VLEVLSQPYWKVAIEEEMRALEKATLGKLLIFFATRNQLDVSRCT